MKTYGNVTKKNKKKVNDKRIKNFKLAEKKT